MINDLVMEDKRLQTLKALSKSFVRENKMGRPMKLAHQWSADFVEGKGSGLIFLLHGSPGVGKTFTAECIAEYVRRPLMVLTSSDIGTDPIQVERNLERNFKTATSWGAVLLIDEADVFMERRSTQDLVRNSLVAGKCSPPKLNLGFFLWQAISDKASQIQASSAPSSSTAAFCS